MAAEQVSTSLPLRTAAEAEVHPLSPLTADEIKASSQLIQSLYPPGTSFLFKQCTLEEPPKARLAPYLDAEHLGRRPAALDRRAFVTYYIRNTVCYCLDLYGRQLPRSIG